MNLLISYQQACRWLWWSVLILLLVMGYKLLILLFIIILPIGGVNIRRHFMRYLLLFLIMILINWCLALGLGLRLICRPLLAIIRCIIASLSMGHKPTPTSSNLQVLKKAIGNVYLIFNSQDQHTSLLFLERPWQCART
jgi:hypothetical protein